MNRCKRSRRERLCLTTRFALNSPAIPVERRRHFEAQVDELYHRQGSYTPFKPCQSDVNTLLRALRDEAKHRAERALAKARRKTRKADVLRQIYEIAANGAVLPYLSTPAGTTTSSYLGAQRLPASSSTGTRLIDTSQRTSASRYSNSSNAARRRDQFRTNCRRRVYSG